MLSVIYAASHGSLIKNWCWYLYFLYY